MGSHEGIAGQFSPEPQCEDCAAALDSGGRQAVSFLLFDSLTVPLVGCEAHLELFRAICELTADSSAKLLSHVQPAASCVRAASVRPAGAGCRLCFSKLGLSAFLAVRSMLRTC